MQTSGQRMTEQRQPHVQPLGWATLVRVLAPCLLGSLLPLAASRSAVAASAGKESPPNVVVILSDDQGWGDVSFNGNRNLQTPHIDSLARQGAAFSNFYVCQLCAPTRAEFLTGRYHPRTGAVGVTRGEERLNPDEATIADTFRAAGYATGIFGKWHNGSQSPYHPNDRGFDEFYGFTSGHWGLYFDPPLDHNGQPTRGDGFIIDDLTDHAMEFISAHRSQPFFCYVPINTPHGPMQVPDRFYEKFAQFEPPMLHRDPEKEDLPVTRAALAMCENIDWNVGRLLEHLERLELSENTIVVFFNDNGPNSFRWNGGMKGRKGSIDEGGVRAVCHVRWPAKIQPGTTVSSIAAAIDWLPTLADMAGISRVGQKPLDGISVKRWLLDPSAPHADRLIHSFKRKQVSVRNQRFRLDAQGRLFDIDADRGQHHDVATRFPAVKERLATEAEKHQQEMVRLLQAQGQRPFTVGFAPRTPLPARDGVPHGSIQRSAHAPNNSFFTHWTHSDDRLTWDVTIGQPGDYHATVMYTCRPSDIGALVRLSAMTEKPDEADKLGKSEKRGKVEASVEAKVTQAFDPPFLDKGLDRSPRTTQSFVKDFKPLSLGTISLAAGPCTLVLQAPEIPGDRAIDVHSIVLTRKLDPADIQVMSYNIRYANPNDGKDVWERRADTVFDVIRQPDIVGLQEVTARQWDAIREAAPDFTWYGVGREDGQRGGEFTPIGFRSDRFQSLDRGTFWLSETPEQVGSRGWDAALPRIASWVMLRDSQTDRRLLVINTHFDHRGAEARLESGKLINQKIPELAQGAPVIVMGDLNAMPDSEPLQALRGGGPATLRDSRSISETDPAGPEGTWNGFERIQDDRRIDHLLVSDGISVERYETLDPKTPEGRFASDHLPVVAEVRLTAPAQ